MIVKPGRGRKAWLAAKLQNGKLIVSIGVETLAFAAQQRLNEQAFDASEGEQDEADLRIVHADTFAADVREALEKEEEDGTNRMHLMLDSAIDYAVEQGSEGIAEAESDIVHSQGGS